MTDLRAEFGDAAELGRELYEELARVERRLGDLKVDSALNALPQEFSTGFFDAALGPLSTPEFQKVFDIGRFDGEGLRKAAAVQNAADAVAGADGMDAQIAALEEYITLYQDAAQHKEGIAQNEAEGLKAALELMATLRKMRAEDQNTAGKEQAEGIAKDLERRAELERTILHYGAQSAEARGVENRQEREALELKLQGLKIDRDSEEGLRALTALKKLQASKDESANEQRRSWLRDQDDRIASLRLEISLIGLSNEEQAKARALAEADLEIRERKLGVFDRILLRARAITAAEAEAELTRKRDVSNTIATAQTKIGDMGEELGIRQQINALVLAGSVNSAEANRLIREELELRP